MALIKLRNLSDPSRTVVVNERVYAIEQKRKNKDGKSISQFKDWEQVPLEDEAEPASTEPASTDKPAKKTTKK